MLAFSVGTGHVPIDQGNVSLVTGYMRLTNLLAPVAHSPPGALFALSTTNGGSAYETPQLSPSRQASLFDCASIIASSSATMLHAVQAWVRSVTPYIFLPLSIALSGAQVIDLNQLVVSWQDGSSLTSGFARHYIR